MSNRGILFEKAEGAVAPPGWVLLSEDKLNSEIRGHNIGLVVYVGDKPDIQFAAESIGGYKGEPDHLLKKRNPGQYSLREFDVIGMRKVNIDQAKKLGLEVHPLETVFDGEEEPIPYTDKTAKPVRDQWAYVFAGCVKQHTIFNMMYVSSGVPLETIAKLEIIPY